MKSENPHTVDARHKERQSHTNGLTIPFDGDAQPNGCTQVRYMRCSTETGRTQVITTRRNLSRHCKQRPAKPVAAIAYGAQPFIGPMHRSGEKPVSTLRCSTKLVASSQVIRDALPEGSKQVRTQTLESRCIMRDKVLISFNKERYENGRYKTEQFLVQYIPGNEKDSTTRR